MKLLINIPKEFEQHFQADRFEDSLHRLRADVHLMAGLYEQETAEMLIEAFKNAVPVPPHGRLIDADALMQSLGITNMECDKCAWCDDKWGRCMRGSDFEDSCCAIEDAPTIIEAEESVT